MLRFTLLTILLSIALAPAARAGGLTWQMDAPAEVTETKNMPCARVTAGALCGTTAWDPFFTLRLPEGGIDARALTRVTLRLHSSLRADHVAVYDKSPNGEWGLGKTLPIQKGWATYRLDLTRAEWGESGGGAGARKWGGSTGKVISFRIDPGNEAYRWLILDSVRLDDGSDAAFQAGVEPEPAGAGELVSLSASGKVKAGAPIQVEAAIHSRQPLIRDAWGFVWLFQGESLIDYRCVPVKAPASSARLTATFPTSPYAFPGAFRARAGIPGLEIPGAGMDAGGAAITLSNPRAGAARTPVATVGRVGGDPALLVDGKPMPPFFALTLDPDRAGRHREFGRAGIHLYSDWFGDSSLSGNLGHLPTGAYAYGAFDAYFADVLAADPKAYFLPHVNITAPQWWQQKHPEEVCTYAGGGTGCQSFASERWRREIAEDLRRLIRHFQSAPYADRILGYIVFTGYSAEWQSWGLWQDRLADYSAPAVAAWRKWLQARYPTDSALRAAWGQPNASLAAAALPSAEQRHHGEWGALRDPAREQQTIDFYQYLSDTTADAICYFSRVAKEACGRKSLVGTYYGYLTQHGARQQDSSHCALARVLRSQDVDFLMSPPLYSDRQVAGTSGFMSATESVRLHGKLWLSEADYRTYLSDPGSDFGRCDTEPESRAVLLREMGNILTRRAAVSWFDMAAGWFGSPSLLADLGRMQEVQRESLSGRKPFHGDVAVFVDEESLSYLTGLHRITPQLVLEQVVKLPRMGAAWDFYLLSDIGSPDVPAHKLYVFLNVVRAGAEMRRTIHARLQREHATSLWVYASGLYGDGGSGVEQIADLTGIRVRREAWGKPLWLGEEKEPLAGSAVALDPVFVVDDPKAQVQARIRGTEWAGLAQSKRQGWTSVFCSVPTLGPDLLRDIARRAGCHIYCATGDALSVDSRYLCLHAAADGKKEVVWPAPADAFDAMTGKPLSRGTARLTLAMKRGETRLVRFGAGVK